MAKRKQFDQLFAYNELVNSHRWLSNEAQQNIIGRILSASTQVSFQEILELYRQTWQFLPKFSPEEQFVYRQTLTRVLFNRFMSGDIPFLNWQEIIDFFGTVVGKQQSYTVPLKTDPEYPTVYATTVAERLQILSREQMLQALQQSKARLFELFIHHGIPAEISETISWIYAGRVFHLR